MAKYDENGFITVLDEGEIFVFGGNGFGAHNGGVAATAVNKFGAVWRDKLILISKRD